MNEKQLPLKLWKLSNALIIVSIFTVSFDIFLIINLGFNFRVSQLLLFIPFIYVAVQALQKNKLYLPLGFKYLLLWAFFIVLFIPNSYGYIRGFGYAFWLIFSIILVISFVNFFSKRRQVKYLFKIYIYSYLFIAAFGLVQFILPVLGLPSLLVTQWVIPGFIPRINGFSYEPSYYSTYLIMGFVLTGYLLRVKSEIFSYKHLRITHYTILLSLLLSTSRMGWVMLLFWYVSYPIFYPPNILKGKLNLKFLKYSIVFVGLTLVSCIVLLQIIGFENIKFLLGGLGIGDTSSHSADARTSSLINTIQVFLKNPIIGVSLGGVAPHIAVINGYNHLTFEVIKAHEGIMVFVEVLAASGVIGFIPFVLYFYELFRKPYHLMQRLNNKSLKQMMGAMIWALFFELIILQFNQNIMRSFLWMHIAILSTMYSVFLKENITGLKIFRVNK